MGSASTGMPTAVRASAMRTAISAVVGAVDAVGQRSFWGGIFRVALDDVGAGYNSLGAVAAVKPDVIKLDISLVSGVHRDPRRAELVRLLCAYAAGQGMGTVAEGIEEAAEADVCTDLGVRWLQGYHLGRPMPLDDLSSRCGVTLRP